MSLADINEIYFSDIISLPRQKHFSTAAVRLNASLNIACTSSLARLVVWVWENHPSLHKHTHSLWNVDGPFYSLPSKLLPLPISFFLSYSHLFQLAFRSFLQFLLFIQCIIFSSLLWCPWSCLLCQLCFLLWLKYTQTKNSDQMVCFH